MQKPDDERDPEIDACFAEVEQVFRKHKFGGSVFAIKEDGTCGWMVNYPDWSYIRERGGDYTVHTPPRTPETVARAQSTMSFIEGLANMADECLQLAGFAYQQGKALFVQRELISDDENVN